MRVYNRGTFDAGKMKNSTSVRAPRNSSATAKSSHGFVNNAGGILHSLKLRQVLVIAAPVLFTVVLVLVFVLIYLRRRTVRRLDSRVRAQFLSGALFSPPYEHGLSKSFRQRLPVFPFDETCAASTEFTQCAVCLAEYEVGEKLEELPGCGHAFHVGCIDKWLASNLTCPICRMCVVLEEYEEDASCKSIGAMATNLSGFSTPPSISLSARGGDSSTAQSRRWEERILSEAYDYNLSLHLQNLVNPPLASSEGSHASSSTNDLTILDNHSIVNIERI